MTTRRYAALLGLLGFVAVLVVLIHAGQAVAFHYPTTEASRPTVTAPPTGPRTLDLNLPAIPEEELNGTDAGLITTPAA